MSAFVKTATDDLTAGWLRQEFGIYDALHADFMPELLGWEDGERPVLLAEAFPTTPSPNHPLRRRIT